jgi:enoyl-CoA hydratase/carnithine racemase
MGTVAYFMALPDNLWACKVTIRPSSAPRSCSAIALARKLASGPTVAYGEIKRLFMQVGASQLEARLEDEALTLARVSATHDAQEGIAAQVERRKPAFEGR